MATILDDEDTIEAQALPTSFDPYGQLVKMLMPRAMSIAIYDPTSLPVWLSDGADSPDLLQLVEEALNAARSNDPDPEERDGVARSWDGETAYVFILRDADNLLGALALACQDGSVGSRAFSVVQGLLRPVLHVLSRELQNQYSIDDLRRDLTSRDGDLELLLDASAGSGEADSDDFEQLLHDCVSHLDCTSGALLIPDKKIAIAFSSDPSTRRTDAEVLEKTQRHLFAWAQVQRRTLMLNKAPPTSPLGALPYKILACPIRHGAQHVAGVLVLFKPVAAEDFDMRQVRIIEMMTRRIAYVLQNSYDPATGLLARNAFEQRALATLTGYPDGQHCVAYADVDRLHAINENYGMHVGDEVITCIAEVIRTNLPPALTASRISGDRFAVFFPDTAIDDAQAFLAHLCTAVTRLDFRHEGAKIGLSVSFGIAAVPATKYPLSHALASAEAACNAAKDHGRGRAEQFLPDATLPQRPLVPELRQPAAPNPTANVRRPEDAAIISRVRDAIANERFRMEAQPILQFGQHGPARRFELLLRMVDPSGESIAPDKFLSAAERHQLMGEIDHWVVSYALEILSSAAPALENLGAHFGINISGQSLADENFPVYLEDKLTEYGLPPQLLSFEVSESAAVANIVRAETLIRRLRELGYGIALDDFGRGLSSLTYLKSLPVSDLKIDGSLVRDLGAGNGRSQATLTAIVQLATSMKLRTTAKCVESDAILQSVGQLGVNFGQGFAIGRPRPLEIVLQELLHGAPGVVRNLNSPRMARYAAQ